MNPKPKFATQILHGCEISPTNQIQQKLSRLGFNL